MLRTCRNTKESRLPSYVYRIHEVAEIWKTNLGDEETLLSLAFFLQPACRTLSPNANANAIAIHQHSSQGRG